MATPTNAARAGTAAPSDEPQPLDLHDLYRTQAACGYTRDLTLYASQVQRITARLRGVTAISSVLLAASDDDALQLSEWLQFGLIEAVNALASDAFREIESTNEHAAKRQGGAA